MTQSLREENEAASAASGKRKLWCLLAGLLAFYLISSVATPPQGMTADGLKVAAVLAWMAIWWLTEAVPLPVTALVPLVTLPAMDVIPMQSATAAYGDPVIFLYLGGFILAIAMQRWGLHKRIALHIVRMVGSSANRIIAGFMLASAFLSMWMNNTSTVMMMLPIGVSVVHLLMFRDNAKPEENSGNFATGLMLGMAYAGSIGGVATLIGSAPNAILAGYVRNAYGIDIGFAQWMLVGVPIAVMLLVMCWVAVVRLFPNHMGQIEGADTLIREELDKLGHWSRGEKLVAVIFGCTALAWLCRPLINAAIPGLFLTDASIAIMGALLLFLVPVSLKTGARLLTWDEAERLPWGILLLFGGGLCLAFAVKESLLAEWVGMQIQSVVDVPLLPLIVLVSAVVLLMTEFISNTATTTTMLPVLGAIAVAFGFAPLELMLPAALMASFAFMMPVATPPNAIVFASGYIRIGQMAYAGAWLNLLALIVVPAFCYWIMGYVFTR